MVISTDTNLKIDLMARGGGHTTCGVAGELIEAEWRIYASVIEAIIGSDNGLSPGPRLNIKTVLSTYGDFHVKDKTAVRTSYL